DYGDQQVHFGAALTVSAPAAAFHLFDAGGRALRRLKPGNMRSSKQGEARN
ncbi:MAG TPA: ABC transporter, partial [Janthinobacterium sp.]|nr:ABC transporter [Janthinobacterium sp.]